MGTNHQSHPRWKKAAKEILDSVHLHDCGILNEDADHIRIRAVCIQVSHPSLNPHTVDVILRKPYPAKVEWSKCSCTGGASGKCKHASALLMYLTTNSELQIWSVTTGRCTWKEELKSIQNSIITPIPLTEMWPHRRVQPLPEIPDFFNSSLYLNFFPYIPENSVYKKFLAGRATAQEARKANSLIEQYQFPQTYTKLYDRSNEDLSLQDLVAAGYQLDFTLSSEDVRHIEEVTRGQASNSKWFAFRTGRITGYVVGAVMKVRSFDSNLSVIENICYPAEKSVTSPAMRWGKEHEKDGLALYSSLFTTHRNFQITSHGLHILRDHPFMGASPDDIAKCDCCGERVVEVKCAYSVAVQGKQFNDLKYLTESKNGLVLNEKHPYYYQIQLEMLTTGIKMADFVVWTPNDYLVLRYPRNDDVCSRMIEWCTSFFHNAIIPELMAKYYSRTHTKRTRKCINESTSVSHPTASLSVVDEASSSVLLNANSSVVQEASSSVLHNCMDSDCERGTVELRYISSGDEEDPHSGDSEDFTLTTVECETVYL